MSISGPTKNSRAGTTRSARPRRMTISASRATSTGAVSDGLTATHRLAPRMQCSRFIAVGGLA